MRGYTYKKKIGGGDQGGALLNKKNLVKVYFQNLLKLFKFF